MGAGTGAFGAIVLFIFLEGEQAISRHTRLKMMKEMLLFIPQKYVPAAGFLPKLSCMLL
jgi:hypothetical protein